MYILAINSSPRKDGNTQAFLNAVTARAEELGAETKHIWLGDKSIKGCRACYGCVQAKKCVYKDDFQAVFEEIVRADAILFGTPTYHASMTADMKALLDRCGFCGRWAANEMKETGETYQWAGSVFSGKVVAPVAVARRTGQTLALAEIMMWAAANDCIIVGNTYWNMGVAGKGGAFDAANDEEGMGIMRGLAERIVHTVQKMKA